MPDNRSLPPQPAWVLEAPPDAETVVSGRRYLYFAGTGYLGLQAHPAVLEAAADAVLRFGVHTATSRSGFGSSPPVLEVERRAAEFLASDEACYLFSGYAVNFALCATLAERVELALVDEAAHDSLREATRWLDRLKRPPLAFRSGDPSHVDELLREHVTARERAIVVTDGVFAVSGRLAPLADYLAVLERYAGSTLLVDDAHGLAVLGQRGRGSLELAGVGPERINRHDDDRGASVFHTGTLSKAVGGQGGIVAGTPEFLARVRSSSGWFRGASAPAAPVATATAKGLELVQSDPELRARLAANVKLVRGGLRGLGLDVADLPTPIVSLVLDSAEAMQQAQNRLADAGILIGYTRDYAGAGPAGMLRIAVFATHTPQMIGRLIEALGRTL
jgi:7-keto-8-aminopelargonate synthetase-like enzyme